MTDVSLIKPYLLDFNTDTDLIVVLRHQLEGAAPWSAHMLHFDFHATPMISNELVGHFNSHQIRTLSTRNGLCTYDIEGAFETEPTFSPLMFQLGSALMEHLWAAIMLDDWSDPVTANLPRVMFLAPILNGEWDYDEDWSPLAGWLEAWDDRAIQRADDMARESMGLGLVNGKLVVLATS